MYPLLPLYDATVVIYMQACVSMLVHSGSSLREERLGCRVTVFDSLRKS